MHAEEEAFITQLSKVFLLNASILLSSQLSDILTLCSSLRAAVSKCYIMAPLC
jgi:hypothetical protein